MRDSLRADDAFRFGISGRFGDATFSTAIEYSPDEIIVIPNRSELTAIRAFSSPTFRGKEFMLIFHYRPPEAPTLIEYVRAMRQSSSEQGMGIDAE